MIHSESFLTIVRFFISLIPDTRRSSNLFLRENNDDASVSSTITLSDESLLSILTSFLEPAYTISASCSNGTPKSVIVSESNLSFIPSI